MPGVASRDLFEAGVLSTDEDLSDDPTVPIPLVVFHHDETASYQL